MTRPVQDRHQQSLMPNHLPVPFPTYSEADKVEEQQENAANDAMLSDAVGDGDPSAMLAQVRICPQSGGGRLFGLRG